MEIADSMQTQAKALADPTRFRLFRFIADAGRPVGVAELTELLGFNHNAIRQHLAVLVEARCITESSEDRKVRGRPRKQYELRADALSSFGSVSGSYQALAELLLEVVGSGETPFDVGYQAGRDNWAGRDIVGSRPRSEGTEPVDALVRQLAVDGFEPARGSGHNIILNHCPFADIASKNPGIVCELHHGLINGQLAAGSGGVTGTLEPRDPSKAGCLVGVIEESASDDYA